MTVFYLVRHAHAVWTPDENRPLSDRGLRDAERVAGVLQPFPITALYASPARRAQQTIAPLATRLDLPIQSAPALAERRLCAGATDDFYSAVQATWDDFSFAHPGGETMAAAQRRGVSLIERLIERHPAGHVVLGTHGNLLAMVLRHYDPSIGYAFWQSLTMPDIYRLAIGGTHRAAIERLFQAGQIWRPPSTRST